MIPLNPNVYLILVLQSIIVKLSHQEQPIVLNVLMDTFLKMYLVNHVKQQSKTVSRALLALHQQNVKHHVQHVFPLIFSFLTPLHKDRHAVHVKFMDVESVKYLQHHQHQSLVYNAKEVKLYTTVHVTHALISSNLT